MLNLGRLWRETHTLKGLQVTQDVGRESGNVDEVRTEPLSALVEFSADLGH